MARFDELKVEPQTAPKTWLVTGAAGFIGSNLLEALLKLDQRAVGLDNFATGKRTNLEQVQALVTPGHWSNFKFIEGSIDDPATCQQACRQVDYVLHQAALGSVPRSIEEPLGAHQANATGFLQMLEAARTAKVRRFVYASSSAVYGDHPALPKVEDQLGRLLSPYAATKLINEIYAQTYAQTYGFASIGLRYFNVFGPRQDPDGAYAAVIPKWIAALLRREPVQINGDGETSRDFCFVDNIVQANLLAATAADPAAIDQAYNIAVGERTTLNELFQLLQNGLRQLNPTLPEQQPVYRDFRAGDVRHSLADISKARRLLGYEPVQRAREGLALAMEWYCRHAS
jgi:UDP-N-acetylglucosamine/UDP-N-acetyl-alpha-D-glucosaminouronate 4-epimerase